MNRDPTSELFPAVKGPLHRPVDPQISKSLGANYEALKNDLEQANEFAGELQKELSVNRNDLAHFKQLFEKTQQDLARLQSGILALREERHRFANDSMRATALEAKVTRLSDERERLLETLAQSQRREEKALASVSQRDAQVANLTMQLLIVKDTLRQARQPTPISRPMKSAAAERLED